MADTPQDPSGDNPFKGTPFEQIFSALGGGGGQLPDISALMGQMQQLMAPYDGAVTWNLAHDLARRTTAQEPDPTPGRADRDRV
ncbi:MAG: hydrolase, partial [Marmoricola sp.]